MRIGVDFDEVVVNQYDRFLEFKNSEQGTNTTRLDRYFKSIEDLFGSKEKKEKIWDRFEDGSEEYENMAPFEEAKEVIPRLAENHHLEIVTGRESSQEEHVRDIVNKCFQDCFEAIHIVGDRDKSKADVCEERYLKHHIEDHPNPAKRCASRGITVLMVKEVDGLMKHWNRNYRPEEDEDLDKPENIVPVYSLEEAEEYIQKTSFKAP